MSAINSHGLVADAMDRVRSGAVSVSSLHLPLAARREMGNGVD
jgi:hypothetical protein